MQRHQHFFTLLQMWYAQLKVVVENVSCDATASGTSSKARRSSSDRFANYEVLEVDDGYFDHSDVVAASGELPASAAGETQKQSAAEREAERTAIFNEAFSQGLLFEVVPYLLELEDLVEAVHNEYQQVKRHKKTLVETTTVVKVASLTEKLQQRCPTIQLAADVIMVLADKMPKGFNMKVATAVVDFWERVQATGYKFVPGVFFAEFNWVTSALVSFTSVIQDDRHTLVLRDGFFDETYSEERTPYYVLPDPSKASSLLLQQLPLIYNLVIYSKARWKARQPSRASSSR